MGGGWFCVYFLCFLKKRKELRFRRKLLRFWVKGRKKRIVKISCTDKRLIFVRCFCFCFALTQKICDCVGFFTLSYRKMLTFFFGLLLFVWVESSMCVMQLLSKKRTFSVQVMMMFPSVEIKIVCYVLKRFYVKIRLSLKKGSLCSNWEYSTITCFVYLFLSCFSFD